MSRLIYEVYKILSKNGDDFNMDVKIYVNGLEGIVSEFEIHTALNEFEKGDSKKVRGFTPIYTASSHDAETGRLIYHAGYIRKIEKDRK